MPAGQEQTTVRLEDNPDWWSGRSLADSYEPIQPPQERELPSSNFQVLGIELDDAMFDRAATKLGKATHVERGDASTGRDQVCYVSTGGNEKVYLIFERGEVDFTFFLFTGGPSWNGIDRCVASNLVSLSSSTASGLHLGLTRAQIIAILGPPTSRSANELNYSVHVRKKLPPAELRELRQQHRDLSDGEFMENYGEYDLNAGVDLKFVHSKLSFLCISKSETN